MNDKEFERYIDNMYKNEWYKKGFLKIDGKFIWSKEEGEK